eukprot:3857131-Pleurochrysis_carterae.AAC.1
MAAVAAMEAAETVLTRLGRRLLAAQQDLEKLERLGGVERGQNGPLEEGQVMPLALADSGRAGASSSLAGSHNTEAVGHSSTEDGMEASSSLGGSARREGDIEASLMVLAELRGHIGACLALLEQPPNQVTGDSMAYCPFTDIHDHTRVKFWDMQLLTRTWRLSFLHFHHF